MHDDIKQIISKKIVFDFYSVLLDFSIVSLPLNFSYKFLRQKKLFRTLLHITSLLKTPLQTR